MRLIAIAFCAAILVQGSSAGAAERLMPDESFGDKGFAKLAPGGVSSPRVTVDRRGRAVVADTFGVTRVLKDGRPDPTFGGAGGTAHQDPRIGRVIGVADMVQGPRGIYTAFATADTNRLGYAISLHDEQGRPRTSFGVRGSIVVRPRSALTVTATAIEVLRDGRIYVAGGFNPSGPRFKAARLVRYLPSGKPDKTFGHGGVLRVRPGPVAIDSLSEFTDVLPTARGGVFVSGMLGRWFVVLKVRPDGTLDRRFGGGDGRLNLPTRPVFTRTLAGARGARGAMAWSADRQRLLTAVETLENGKWGWKLMQISLRGRVLKNRTTNLPRLVTLSSGDVRPFEPSTIVPLRGGQALVAGFATGSDDSGLEEKNPVLVLVDAWGKLIHGFGIGGVKAFEKSPMWDFTDAHFQPGFGVTLVGAEANPWKSNPHAAIARFIPSQ